MKKSSLLFPFLLSLLATPLLSSCTTSTVQLKERPAALTKQVNDLSRPENPPGEK